MQWHSTKYLAARMTERRNDCPIVNWLPVSNKTPTELEAVVFLRLSPCGLASLSATHLKIASPVSGHDNVHDDSSSLCRAPWPHWVTMQSRCQSQKKKHFCVVSQYMELTQSGDGGIGL